jgi:glycosyltransferase involved in cell wall biosynthesis
MNILLIRKLNPFFETGASANRFAGLVRGLTGRGVQITILVTGGYTSFHEYSRKGIPGDVANLKVVYTCVTFNNNIWLRRFNTYVISKVYNNRNERKIAGYLKSKYDYIWLTNDLQIMKVFSSNYDSVTTKTFMELNEFHDIYKETGAIGNSLQQASADATNDAFLKVISKIDRFAFMTTTLSDYYKNFIKSDAKSIHLPMTVDIERFINVSGTDCYRKPYIAYTGTFNNAKDGVDILIKAFAKVAAKFHTIHLYLAGFWHYDVPAQKKLISELGLDDRITYLGVLSTDKVPEFVCNADLLVLSRPDSHQAQGGFPTKLGEYLATAKPVCVTTVGEIPDYLEDNVSAFLASPGDVDSFADAMDRALSDYNIALKVGQRGREVAKSEFNAGIQSARLYEFLMKG